MFCRIVVKYLSAKPQSPQRFYVAVSEPSSRRRSAGSNLDREHEIKWIESIKTALNRQNCRVPHQNLSRHYSGSNDVESDDSHGKLRSFNTGKTSAKQASGYFSSCSVTSFLCLSNPFPALRGCHVVERSVLTISDCKPATSSGCGARRLTTVVLPTANSTRGIQKDLSPLSKRRLPRRKNPKDTAPRDQVKLILK